jgi:rubrerythrin
MAKNSAKLCAKCNEDLHKAKLKDTTFQVVSTAFIRDGMASKVSKDGQTKVSNMSKNGQASGVTVWVCASCGHIEFYADNPSVVPLEAS